MRAHRGYCLKWSETPPYDCTCDRGIADLPHDLTDRELHEEVEERLARSLPEVEADANRLAEALRAAERGLTDGKILIDMRWKPKKEWSGHWCSNESEMSDSVEGALEEVREALRLHKELSE